MHIRYSDNPNKPPAISYKPDSFTVMLLQVAESKTLGNAAIKKQQYTEAAVYYTKAIKIESELPKSYIKTLPQLYSNRSLAYLKLKQYTLALHDAQETIRLHPDWFKVNFMGLFEYLTGI